MEEAILRFALDEPQGQQFTYNSANSQLLMLVLLRATGKPYADYVAEKLWRPLGAKPARLWHGSRRWYAQGLLLLPGPTAGLAAHRAGDEDGERL